MISIQRLTKHFGDRVAVNDLSFTVQAGKVTGFLGPNGAGKSTTMRMLLGLDSPTSGAALVDGKPYRELKDPLRKVGALLEAKSLHPRRSARNHLLAQAHSHGIPARRVDEVLAEVHLTEVAGKPAGEFSLGMSQRLGIAGALLGDPEVLMFDEPVNGLDPDGVRWVRELVRAMAGQGRTVLLSSHLMSEMQLTADHLVIIGRGELIADTSMADLIRNNEGNTVTVRSPETRGLGAVAEQLRAAFHDVRRPSPYELVVRGAAPEQVGDACFRHRVPVHRLQTSEASLENVYMELTAGAAEYAAPVERVPEAGALMEQKAKVGQS
ncbi:ABC transporter ATP-binding protein [Amycolatopsis jiangsuensis]|uniref:ABC-2 type transport system ATP-binding protein n=1 Tax=Amycolatopsis jiangsuensis TaxID=1181879 RepID=A0A840IP87_9PSEU|nr:ABC transporter ATP-binding protein [Amycolatopsis jiangsuensis]MBB4683760.1 ABC-2 type transport system ATP-binding protein [Amycolatopsis jiangsuensis]